MRRKQIKLLCTDSRCEQRESLYIFECGNQSDSLEILTNIQFITYGDISNQELCEILKSLIELNQKQNKDSFNYPPDLLFKSGTYV